MVRLHDHEVTLERLSASHSDALLAFERENREYFAASVPDRGDAYFDEFDLRHESLRAEQEAGICQFHVLVDAAGAVVGRVNLVDLENRGGRVGLPDRREGGREGARLGGGTCDHRARRIGVRADDVASADDPRQPGVASSAHAGRLPACR